MGRVRTNGMTMSLDGFVAGPDQSEENPLGVGAQRLHEWIFATRTFRRTHGMEGGDAGLDDDEVARGSGDIGATIMGRNMFGPVRGPWSGSDWTGWWGPNPPFHHPVFVLTHYPRGPIEMDGGTTFHFVTDGVAAAHAQATEAAGGQDVVVGGGAHTVQQFLAADLLDELYLVVVPLLLGRGERLFEGHPLEAPGWTCTELVASSSAAHFRLSRR